MRRTLLLLTILTAGLCAQPATKPWWEKEPLRIVDIIMSLSRIDEIDPAGLAAWKASNLYNAEHLEIMSMHGGLDDQGFFFKSKVAGKTNPDYLARYVPEAHKRGIRVLIYFDVHWYKTAFGEQHPDWRQTTESGLPVSGVYDNGTDFCLNSPWREWCFQVLRDLCAEGVDGIFYDGPVFRVDTCYCHYCRDKYRRLYGEEMPSKKDRKGPAGKRLMDFQVQSMAEYLRDSNRIIKSANPNAAFYMNGGVRGANWPTARFNRRLIEHQDLLGSEGGFLGGDLTRVPMWKPGLTARLLETQAGGKPTIIFSAAGLKPWTFSLLPAPEVKLLYADTIANAAGVWMGLSTFDMKQPEMKAITEMNGFLARNGAYFKNTRSEARVALVWSDTTADVYDGAPAQMIDIDKIPSRSAVGDLESEFGGVADALIRSHTPFDVIDDVTLERDPLNRYTAIFLPNAACMSDAAAGRLKEYVRGGGNIFATFETSLYDATGLRRPDFALAEVLGVHDARKIVGPTRWDFMKPMKKHALLEGIQRELVPSAIYHLRVQPAGADVLLQYTKPLGGRYDGVPDLTTEPALSVNQYGKGRAIYFSGDFGNVVASFHLPEFLRLARNVVASTSPSPLRLENVPSSVEVVLRSQNGGKRKLLHLVNFTGEMTRPITTTLPLRDVRVTLPGVTKAYTLMRPQTLPVAGGVVTIPRVDQYEVLVLE